MALACAVQGAKVVLVGDPAQLQSVDAGGAFNMLAAARGGDLARLVEVRRFVHVSSLAAREPAALEPFAAEPVTESRATEEYRFVQNPSDLAREIESTSGPN